jgi:hypothetical protein
MPASQQYDSATIAILRRALDEVFTDPRFSNRRSMSALEVAEHLLAQAASGERDFDRLKASAFNKLMSQLTGVSVSELTLASDSVPRLA